MSVKFLPIWKATGTGGGWRDVFHSPLHQWDFTKSNYWLGHICIVAYNDMSFCPSTKYETRSIKFLAKHTNTRTHSHSRKEETKSSTHSEWRTNFTSPLCRLNSLTYSMSCYSTPSCLSLSCCLMHTLSTVWYTLEWRRLCVSWLEPRRAQRAKQRHWYRDSSLYCLYTTYSRPALYADVPIGELRDPGQQQSVGGWGVGNVFSLSLCWGSEGFRETAQGGWGDNLAPVLIFDVLSACWRPVFFIVIISLSFFIVSPLHSGELRAFGVPRRSTARRWMRANVLVVIINMLHFMLCNYDRI